jgi:hypothetical protein
MLGRRTFAQAFASLLVFWFVGEIFLGYNRTLMADTFTGNVYLYHIKPNGSKALDPVGAQIKVDIIDRGYLYDKVAEVSGSALRIKFTGNTDQLKRYGIDPGMMIEGSSGGICEIKKSNSGRQQSMFLGGMTTEHSAYEFQYASAHHMTFYKILDDDIDCKTIHLGILNSGQVQIVFDNLKVEGMIFADMTRDTHVPFIQRIAQSFGTGQEDLLATFLAKK